MTCLHCIRLPLRRALVGLASLCFLIAHASAQTAEKSPPLDLEGTRTILDKWIETERIISAEQNDWKQGKGILQERIELVKREITRLEEQRAEIEKNITEADRQKAEQVSLTEELKTQAAVLQDTVVELEEKVRALHARLPETLKAKLLTLYQRIPQNPESSKASLAERFQNILGILNEANKLNNEVTVANEVRTLSNGKPAEVRTLYVGLSQGYYVSQDGYAAGIGRPAREGWDWKPADKLASEIEAAFTVLQSKEHPRFVELPITID
jgi:hypothetical protein